LKREYKEGGKLEKLDREIVDALAHRFVRVFLEGRLPGACSTAIRIHDPRVPAYGLLVIEEPETMKVLFIEDQAEYDLAVEWMDANADPLPNLGELSIQGYKKETIQ